MSFDTGELDQRVRLARVSEVAGSDGRVQRVIERSNLLWAKVRPMSGRERDRANQTEYRANYLVVIRNHPGLVVNAWDHIEWSGWQMNIRFAKDRGDRPAFLEIEVELNAPQ